MQLSYIHILQADAYISQLKTTNNRFGSVIAPVALGFRDSLRRRMADRKDKEPPSEKRKVTTDLALEYGTPDSPGYHTLASLMGRDGEYAIFRKFSMRGMRKGSRWRQASWRCVNRIRGRKKSWRRLGRNLTNIVGGNALDGP